MPAKSGLDNRMTAEVMKAFSKSSESGPRREKPLLSDREKEIVQLVAQGFRNKEIGEKLFHLRTNRQEPSPQHL